METVLECITLLSFCIAVGSKLLRFAKNESKNRGMDRFTVITIGIGFVLGGVMRAMTEPVSWTFMLYIAGAVLCYTAALLSFPGTDTNTKKQECESE